MYIAIVLTTMVLLPLISTGIYYLFQAQTLGFLGIFSKWFLFWAFGVRLFVAGLRQVFQPSFTAEHIFEITDRKSYVLVQELGFASISFGLVGILTLFFPSWSAPSLLLGTIFYGLAGINHIFKDKNRTEWIAMISDLYAAAIFLILFFIRLENS